MVNLLNKTYENNYIINIIISVPIVINKPRFIINVSSLVYIKAQPTLNASNIGSLHNNANITSISKYGDWYKVKTNEGIGYVYSEYVGISNEALGANPSNTQTNKIELNYIPLIFYNCITSLFLVIFNYYLKLKN